MIPLFKPKPLTGKYVGQVLASGHVTTGPMVERLREAIWSPYGPNHIAIGASCTACLEAIHRLVQWSGLELKPKATWPLFQELAGPCSGSSCDYWTLYTDIGGRTAEPLSESWKWTILDCSHSWEPMFGGRFSIASISPIKLCDGVQGGVVWCEHQDEARELQGILNYGFLDGHDKPRDWRTRDPRGWRWNMSDVHAALNLEAFERLEETKAGYKEAWYRLVDQLGQGHVVHNAPRLVPQDSPYLAQFKVRSVPRAIKTLNENGVAGGWNFPPAKLVTVPAWPGMHKDTVRRVASAVKTMLEVEWNGAV